MRFRAPLVECSEESQREGERERAAPVRGVWDRIPLATGVGAIAELAVIEQWKSLNECRLFCKVADDVWDEFTTALGEPGFEDDA